MSTVEESIDVDAPVRVVYDQWATFENFPKFVTPPPAEAGGFSLTLAGVATDKPCP
ncbi:hypothetical protein ACFXDE_27930 [Kitasatospora sp. NPDC059408]|uniref:hypothetical protein n=1 Tax=Kitasatospora sp. NPDC059408 TaxID=3346823 RepID=UPI0036A82248